MVIPGSQDRTRFQQTRESGIRCQLVIFRFHDRHVGGVGVDVVTEKDKHFRMLVGNGFEDRHRLVLLDAGTEHDPREGLECRILQVNHPLVDFGGQHFSNANVARILGGDQVVTFLWVVA